MWTHAYALYIHTVARSLSLSRMINMSLLRLFKPTSSLPTTKETGLPTSVVKKANEAVKLLSAMYMYQYMGSKYIYRRDGLE